MIDRLIEELDVGVGETVGAAFFSPVHGVQLLLVALYEAEFEDEFSPSDEAFVCFTPVYGRKDAINVIAQ